MGIKAILFDIDGVLCIRDRVIEGSVETVSELRKHYKLAFVTNTTRTPTKKVLQSLVNCGFELEEGELFTALRVAKDFVLSQGGGAYLLSTDEAYEEFDVPKEPVKYVVVADAYKNFTYDNLNTAFRYLLEGAELIAVAPNRYFMDKDGKLSLDAGPFVKALEYASGKSARIIGKPAKDFFNLVLKALGVEPHEALMVGDDIEFDVKGAQDAGIRGVLVKTGKFRPEDLKKGIEPFAILESVAELPRFLSSAGFL